MKKLIELAKKYRKQVNNAILFFAIVSFTYYLILNWYDAYQWVIHFPSDMWEVMKRIYHLGYKFVVKFVTDMITFPNNLKIISIGVIKRFVIEDLIIPILVRNYWNIVKVEMILYYRLKIREIKKLPVLLFGPIIAPIGAIFTYFNVLKLLGFWFKKIFANKIFSKIKIAFITYIPAIWVFLMDLPIVSLIIEYGFLAKIVSYFKQLEIPYVTKSIKRVMKKLDLVVQRFQSFFNKHIGEWLKRKAVAKKFKTREKINSILEKNSDDYHVQGKGYDYKAFSKKLSRLKNWKQIRKSRKKREKQIKRKIKIIKAKKLPAKIKEKIRKKK